MNAFHKKYLMTPPTRVGSRLQKLRQKYNVTLTELSKKTKINREHLQMMEDCHFKKLKMAPIYQKNFVRKYVEALGVNPEPFIKQFIIEEMIENKKNKHPHKIIKFKYSNFLPSIIRYGLIIIIALSLIGYLGWQVKQIIEPPNLIIYTPQEGNITKEKQLIVKGKTDKTTSLTINGQDVGHTETGNFEATLDLTNGVNTITITAKKRHGKTTTEVRHIILKT